jgi:iron complex outermembrane receptor protein
MFANIRKDDVRRPFLIATLVAMAGISPAHAQNAQPILTADAQPVVTADNNTVVDFSALGAGGTIETVTVTAQKRSENIQEVPQALTAISGSEITSLDIDSPADLGRLVPNFSAQSSNGQASKPRWFIRGLGSNDPSVNLESEVGIYQDEVYVGLPAAQNFPIFDLSQVEVLRGPQGTLWGKNTTGGAVSFISAAPSFNSSGGYAKLDLGDYGAQILQGAYNSTVIDDVVATRASFYYDRAPSYAKNLYTGENGPDTNDFAGRLQFLVKVGDSGDLNLNFHIRNLTGGAGLNYPIGINAGGADNNGFIPSYGTDPKVGDPYYAGLTDSTQRTYGVTGKADWNFANGISLTSISNFDWSTVYSQVSPGNPPNGTPDQTSTLGTTGYHQASEELRLESAAEDRLSWLIGYNYFQNYFNVLAVSATDAPTTRTAYTRTTLLQNGDSNAVFGNAKYKFTDDLSLTVGLRDTFDTKNVKETTLQGGARGTVLFNNVGDPFETTSITAKPGSSLSNYAINGGRTWNEFTYDVTPQYQVADNINVYGRVARGFRSGAFNPTITTVGVTTPVIAQTQPETLFSTELGAKTEWFDNRLVFNVAAYHYDLKNIQLNVQQSNPTGIANATTSTIQNAAAGWDEGLEFDGEVTPIENLHITSGVSFTDTRYKDFLTYQGSTLVNASGNQFYRTPKFTSTIDVTYVIPLDVGGAVTLDTDWSYRSHVYFNAVVQNDPFQEQGGYALGNVHLSYLTPNGKFEFSLYSNNILDQSWKILTQVANNGAYPVALGQPRTSGFSLEAKL